MHRNIVWCIETPPNLETTDIISLGDIHRTSKSCNKPNSMIINLGNYNFVIMVRIKHDDKIQSANFSTTQ